MGNVKAMSASEILQVLNGLKAEDTVWRIV
jgi:hypothetical protein